MLHLLSLNVSCFVLCVLTEFLFIYSCTYIQFAIVSGVLETTTFIRTITLEGEDEEDAHIMQLVASDDGQYIYINAESKVNCSPNKNV